MAIYYARKAGNINASDVWATTPTGAAGDVFGSFTSNDTLMSNNFAITINVNTTVLEIRNDAYQGATAGGNFTISTSITLNADVRPLTTCVIFNGAVNITATINGNIYGPNSTNSVAVLFNSGVGVLNINGNITSPLRQGATISNLSSGTINITSASIIAGSDTNATTISNGASGTINIIGNITAIGNFNQNVHVASNSSNGVINITGNVIGGSFINCFGANNSGTGSIFIVGIVTGGAVSAGARNASTGTLTVTRAKGNGFGNGSVGLNSVVGVDSVQNATTYVYEIEYGDLGQSPTSGPVFLLPSTNNVALFYRPNLTKKTLVSSDNYNGLLPNSSDVRLGVVYNAGNNIGSMSVPGISSVASGVPVDNSIGTALLTTDSISSIWNYPISEINVSGSIGERLKNSSTIASVAEQLVNIISN